MFKVSITMTKSLDNSAILSPCVKICKYDKNFMNGMVCIGCFREQFEITSWTSMSANQKKEVIENSKERRVKFNHKYA